MIAYRPSGPMKGYPPIETWISRLEAYALATAARGKRVLEIGSAHGFSAVLMAQNGARITSVDPHTDYGSWTMFQQNLERYEVAQRVSCIRQRSQDVLPHLIPSWYELAFVDGDHSAAVAEHDIRWCLRLLQPGGILAVHDFTPRWPGVVEACERQALRDRPHWRIETLLLVVIE